MNRKKVVNLNNPPNSWKDQLINAGIMAGLGFFTTLAGIGAVGLMVDMKLGFLASGISAGFEFFLALALQRGLMKKED